MRILRQLLMILKSSSSKQHIPRNTGDRVKAVFKSFQIFWAQEVMLFWNGQSVNGKLIKKSDLAKFSTKFGNDQ
jgi:hypothetical protein